MSRYWTAREHWTDTENCLTDLNWLLPTYIGNLTHNKGNNTDIKWVISSSPWSTPCSWRPWCRRQEYPCHTSHGQLQMRPLQPNCRVAMKFLEQSRVHHYLPERQCGNILLQDFWRFPTSQLPFPFSPPVHKCFSTLKQTSCKVWK